VNEELFLAREKTLSDRQTSILSDRCAQLLVEVAVNIVKLLQNNANSSF